MSTHNIRFYAEIRKMFPNIFHQIPTLPEYDSCDRGLHRKSISQDILLEFTSFYQLNMPQNSLNKGSRKRAVSC